MTEQADARKRGGSSRQRKFSASLRMCMDVRQAPWPNLSSGQRHPTAGNTCRPSKTSKERSFQTDAPDKFLEATLR